MVDKKVPDCYGHLFVATDQLCMACLIRDQCQKATERPTNGNGQKIVRDEIDMPKDKKSLILAICRKYKIKPVYRDKQGNEWEVTEENKNEYTNLDFLLTDKATLRLFLSTRLADED